MTSNEVLMISSTSLINNDDIVLSTTPFSEKRKLDQESTLVFTHAKRNKLVHTTSFFDDVVQKKRDVDNDNNNNNNKEEMYEEEEEEEEIVQHKCQASITTSKNTKIQFFISEIGSKEVKCCICNTLHIFNATDMCIVCKTRFLCLNCVRSHSWKCAGGCNDLINLSTILRLTLKNTCLPSSRGKVNDQCAICALSSIHPILSEAKESALMHHHIIRTPDFSIQKDHLSFVTLPDGKFHLWHTTCYIRNNPARVIFDLIPKRHITNDDDSSSTLSSSDDNDTDDDDLEKTTDDDDSKEEEEEEEEEEILTDDSKDENDDD